MAESKFSCRSEVAAYLLADDRLWFINHGRCAYPSWISTSVLAAHPRYGVHNDEVDVFNRVCDFSSPW
jgi:hypothetical protein